MHSTNGQARSLVAVLVILIAFLWIGFAYIMGTESKRMLLHPIVPIIIILLLLGFRKDNSVRSIIFIAITLIILWILVRLQNVFMPFIIGFTLAYIVNVSLSGLQHITIPLPKGRRIHFSKVAAIATLIILIIGFIAFLTLGIVPQLIQQVRQMNQGITAFYNSIKDYTLRTMEGLEWGDYPFVERLPKSWQPAFEGWMAKLVVYIQDKLPVVAKHTGDILKGILVRLSSGLMGTIGQISSAFFILIVFVYAIQSFQSHMEKILNLVPESQRNRVIRYALEIDANMRSFLMGQLAVIVIISAISVIAYSIIRVPFALLVGLLAGLCNAIPTVGPIIGGGIAILASIVGFVAGNYGLSGFLIQLVLVIGVVFGIQLLDNSLISPKIMSKALNVHPLVVMFAVLLSASLIGIWGAVLAIPGIVVFKAIIKVNNEIRIEQT